MPHRTEHRDVVAAERISDGVRGRIVSRSQLSARVRWPGSAEVEHVWFDDDRVRFLTAAEARRA